MSVVLRKLDVSKFAIREFKPDGKDKPTYYINKEETRRDNVKFQIGDTDMQQHELPFAILPPASYKDSNPDKPSLMLAIPNEEAQRKIDDIDKRLAQLIYDNCRDAIKQGASLEYITDMQTKILRQPSKEGGKVFVSLKLNKQGKYRTNVAKLVSTGDETNPYAQYPATFDDIHAHTIVFALVELSPVWFRGKEWGVSLNATDLLIIDSGDSDAGGRGGTSGFVLYDRVVTKVAPSEPTAGGSGSGSGSAGFEEGPERQNDSADEEHDGEPPVKKSRA